ncbi:unnamed protein product [Rotaria sp. Silwood1]|nr:unnamed protein product [Rotaria sp. Silwood1]CAF3356170.1 unnamed protein product [Rotaria sp. Silwood1]CAF4754893.1 unnamed protein product [Rotaria sp. Silwood1]
MSLIDTVYLKDGRTFVPLKGIMGLIDSLLEIRSQNMIVIKTEPDESMTTHCNNGNDQNGSYLRHQPESITTIPSHHTSTSPETTFSLCNLKLLLNQLNPVLKALQNESSKSLCNMSQENDSENYWIWHLENTSKILIYN